MKFFLKLLLFLYPFILLADETGYKVEIIIYEDMSNKYTNSEKWSLIEDTPSPTNKNNPSQIKQNNYQDSIYEPLATERSHLSAIVEKLSNHNDYNVLVHKLWKQSGLDTDKAFPIQIDSKITPNMIQTSELESKYKSKNTQLLQSFLTGNVTLVMSRYLHIKADLHYHRHIPLTESESLPLKTDNQPNYKLESTPIVFERRMRSRETHFIDHPLIGMIVLAEPFRIKTEISDTQQKETTRGVNNL
ncbi:MAG: peptidoglycan binding protein CsiV [Gammaproteobacteria bacterium]|nr:peptidoglycan binding protein CsiV [Gammaproteobacteria bacterium]